MAGSSVLGYSIAGSSIVGFGVFSGISSIGLQAANMKINMKAHNRLNSVFGILSTPRNAFTIIGLAG